MRMLEKRHTITFTIHSDPELQELMKNGSTTDFRQHMLPSGKLLWCDVSQNCIRPYIPKVFRKKIFDHIHGMSHPGIKSTVRQMTSRFIWPDIKKQTRQWAQTCINCQKVKVTKHTKSKFGEFQEPDSRFSTVHIDIIGPLPPSDGKIYCLTCIDRFSCWTEVIPLECITAELISKAFYTHWISRFGAPITIITDQGRQFTSQLFSNLAAICGAKILHTTPYHPQCNGKIERFHRTLKTAIKAHNNIKWTETLPTVMLGLRAAIREDTNHSIAQMVYGTNIRLPGEFFESPQCITEPDTFVSQLQQHMALLKPLKSQHATNQTIFIHKDLCSCSHVFVRVDRVKKTLEPAYNGPYSVSERHDKYFTIMIKGQKVNISVDRLKPAYLLVPDNAFDLAGSNQSNNETNGKLPQNQTNPQRNTRSGRRIKLPVRFQT